jgi:hypothetical protein
MSILNYQDKEYLLKHIEFLESRYEHLMPKDNHKWLDNWDEFVSNFRERKVDIFKDFIETNKYSLTYNEFLKGREMYRTPMEFLDKEGGDFYVKSYCAYPVGDIIPTYGFYNDEF